GICRLGQARAGCHAFAACGKQRVSGSRRAAKACAATSRASAVWPRSACFRGPRRADESRPLTSGRESMAPGARLAPVFLGERMLLPARFLPYDATNPAITPRSIAIVDNLAFQDLMRRVRAGDPAAASELVRQYEGEIRRVIRVRLDARLGRVLDSMDI